MPIRVVLERGQKAKKAVGDGRQGPVGRGGRGGRRMTPGRPISRGNQGQLLLLSREG